MCRRWPRGTPACGSGKSRRRCRRRRSATSSVARPRSRRAISRRASVASSRRRSANPSPGPPRPRVPLPRRPRRPTRLRQRSDGHRQEPRLRPPPAARRRQRPPPHPLPRPRRAQAAGTPPHAPTNGAMRGATWRATVRRTDATSRVCTTPTAACGFPASRANPSPHAARRAGRTTSGPGNSWQRRAPGCSGRLTTTSRPASTSTGCPANRCWPSGCGATCARWRSPSPART